MKNIIKTLFILILIFPNFLFSYNYSKDNPEYLLETNLYDLSYKTQMADIVMLGDSITFRVNWEELLGTENSTIVNRGINGDTTVGFLHRLNNIYKLKPKKVFIMGGINDIILNLDINDTFNNYKNIILALQKNNIKPIVQSTLYTKYEKFNIKVTILNKLLKEFCTKENIIYIDLNSKISNNSSIINDYSTDGIHLNYKGYNIWRSELEKYID
ncbi:GDSL-type esterase/lipase family protein [Pseudofrancisella aestuarii]|uniref:GDSL-type esterase/lipase family protein n=1 Tax=Pseudofrancisella aestuarii TaxID=2670347 RepID=A0ABV9TCH5_9GAMM|nr:GDSL-type esterase/lipase family protein [Pseudofrancisella aestuarii]